MADEPDIKDHPFIDPGPPFCGLCGLAWKRHVQRPERRKDE